MHAASDQFQLKCSPALSGEECEHRICTLVHRIAGRRVRLFIYQHRHLHQVRVRRRETRLLLKDMEIHHFLPSLPHPEVAGGGGQKAYQSKESQGASSREGATMENWFTDIGLSEEEPRAEGPPPKKKKKIRSKARMDYKYSCAKFF